jgi:hypothetical protein
MVIHIPNNMSNYFLHGNALAEVSRTKYLGVTIHNNLKLNKHISNIKTKATKTLGFTKRNLKDCKPPIPSIIYQAMVCLSLGYASSIYDPYYQNLKKILEGVQMRAAK